MKEVKKPWGNFKLFALNRKCTFKLLTLNPNQEISLQSHKSRRENWYFLDSAIAQVGNKKFHVKEGDFIHIKKGEKHRVISQKNRVRFLEIVFDKFSEKEITRYEDKYGRV